ncbi:MAG: hypothetical protein RJA99_4913 [Pseudomonadota bacterium]|jgi:hypothetical protein
MNADAPPGCDAVLAALAHLDAAPRAVVRVEVVAGRSPDGFTRLALQRDGGTERWVLDGRPLRRGPAQGAASEALRLAPEGPCERLPDADAPGARAFGYDAWAERDRARIVLRVAADGRPADARRDGPELAWGRALSRPTRPPQPALRPTGGRLVERIDFDLPGRDTRPVPQQETSR